VVGGWAGSSLLCPKLIRAARGSRALCHQPWEYGLIGNSAELHAKLDSCRSKQGYRHFGPRKLPDRKITVIEAVVVFGSEADPTKVPLIGTRRPRLRKRDNALTAPDASVSA